MENYDVVKKLIGNITPVGETNEDNKRFENLKEMCKLMEQIHIDLDDISYRYKDRHEFSIKRAVEYIDKFFDKTGIKE